jgi:hypothetical protein
MHRGEVKLNTGKQFEQRTYARPMRVSCELLTSSGDATAYAQRRAEINFIGKGTWARTRVAFDVCCWCVLL